MIKYWINVITQSNSLTKNIYQILKDDADINRNYSGQNWAFQIKTILQQHGFEYVWNNQYDIEIPLAAIKERICDTCIYSQKLYSDINNSSRLQS